MMRLTLTYLLLNGVTWFVDVEVACFSYEGVDAVKNALRAGLNLSTEDLPIKVNKC